MARQEFYIALVQHCVEEIKNLTALDSILKGKLSLVLHSLLFFPFFQVTLQVMMPRKSLVQALGMGLDSLCLF